MKDLHLNLYQKFISAMILGGIIPMFILSSVILNRMFKDYETSLLDSYEQSLDYVSGSVKNLFDTYDEVLKLLYNYDDNDVTVMALNYDRANTIKGILEIGANDELSEAEAKRLRNTRMSSFVRYIAMTNADIAGAFFLDANNNVYGHVTNSYFANEDRLREEIDLSRIDRETKQMQFFPTHYNDYFKNKKDLVFSLSRNYFDLSGAVGKYKYLGSLFIEIDIDSLERLFINTQIFKQGEVYILDEQDRCIYSNKEELITQVLSEGQIRSAQDETQLTTERVLYNNWRIIYKIPYSMVFYQLKRAQRIMFGVLIISLIALILTSSVFSKKMTAPIRAMISKMEAIENGDFSIEIPVRSKDELGLLSDRFNQMARELDSYINKYYVAQIKQNEAELTALKSQIYPHFLYNTLEVIRMTAVSNDDFVVSDMIEALADQIHYIIGSTNDLVRLEKELDIIRKYVFLLNCRISGQIVLTVEDNGLADYPIPQLILQPLVENAYIHGIKPLSGSGNIHICAERVKEHIEITVMDNGVGMSGEQLEVVRKLLDSNESGIRNEETWHSIGMKNVHDRIRHLYGKEYGIELTGSEGIGTSVKISIPFEERQE